MQKGQGSLELLLLVGGAVVVSAIVLTLLLSITNSADNQQLGTFAASLCRQNAASDGSFDCDGPGDRSVAVGNGKTYLCSGTYPYCNASLHITLDPSGPGPSGGICSNPGICDFGEALVCPDDCLIEMGFVQEIANDTCIAAAETNGNCEFDSGGFPRDVFIESDIYCPIEGDFAIHTCGGSYPDCTATFNSCGN